MVKNIDHLITGLEITTNRMVLIIYARHD
jgi:hypothetical protein